MTSLDAESTESPRKPRKCLAVVLSLLLPGLGHAYAGHFAVGTAIIAIASFTIQPALAALTLHAAIAGLAATLILVPAIPIAAAWDAVRRLAKPSRLRWRRARTALICVSFSFAAALIQIVSGWIRDDHIARAYYMPSGAMLPTLLIGDYVMVDPRAYRGSAPSRGDIVVFAAARGEQGVVPRDRHPDLPTESFAKRVVGVPGDSVVLDGAALYVNGDLVTAPPGVDTFTDERDVTSRIRDERLGGRSYRVLDGVDVADRRFGPFTVEPERYFVAGDSRENSNDSRYWGTVHRDDITGAIRAVYWSWELDELTAHVLFPNRWRSLIQERTRWGRIGLRPE